MNCRHCHSELKLPLVDLGSAPPSNAYLSEDQLRGPEKWYPLRVLVCEQCWLVQTEDFADAEELFDSEYAYFSGFSNTWLAHCERYVADMVDRFALTEKSHVVEIAANDGSLLQYVATRDIPCTGVEPTAGTAAAARAKGIPIVGAFFGTRLAEELAAKGQQADLIAANNVLAHVPDINDFVAGFTILLEPEGVATFEFPHLPRLIAGHQFDTVYHEHFSYLSLTAAVRILEGNGLTVIDVEQHPTHGGSLRVFAQRSDGGQHPRQASVNKLLEQESAMGVGTPAYYMGFQTKVEKVKNDFVRLLLDARSQDKTVAAYGAAAKGNTLLNYAGVRPDLIAFVADRNPAKQGKYMPGSRIPIRPPEALIENRPEIVVILPWNLADEVIAQLVSAGVGNATFVTAIPELRRLQ